MKIRFSRSVTISSAVLCLCSVGNFGIYAQTAGTRSIVFGFTGVTQVWTVLSGANISTITVEAWGGGGGGSTMGGGQGGSYFKAQFAVIPNQQVRVDIGAGGAGATAGTDKAGNGGTTLVNFGPMTITAGGGAGAGTGGSGSYSNPTSTANVNNISFRGVIGQFGSPSRMLSTSYIDAKNTLAVSVGGDGGESGNSNDTKGSGGTESCVLSPPTSGSTFQPCQCNPFPAWGTVVGAGPLGLGPSPGVAPGGGGGGTPLTSVFSKKLSGASGAPGLVVMTY